MPRSEYRQGACGVIRLMAKAEGYCMIRYTGKTVWTMSENEWVKLPLCDKKGKLDTFMLATGEDDAMLNPNVADVIPVHIVPVTPERKRKP